MATEARTQMNGWDLDDFQGAVKMVEDDPQAGKLTWRSHVEWDAGFGVDVRTDGIEQLGQVMPRKFTLRGDHPPELLGHNTGPTAVETLLAGLGSCIAGTFAAQATAQGVEIRRLVVEIESPIDLSGMFRLRPVRPGLAGVDVRIHVDSDADEAALEEIRRATTEASPVYDSVANPVAIDSRVVRAAYDGPARLTG